MCEVLNRAAGEVGSLDSTEPPTPGGNRRGKKVVTEAYRALEPARASETHWRGRAEDALNDVRIEKDEIEALLPDRDQGWR